MMDILILMATNILAWYFWKKRKIYQIRTDTPSQTLTVNWYLIKADNKKTNAFGSFPIKAGNFRYLENS